MMMHRSKYKKAHKCATPYCRNNKKKKESICSKCSARRWKNNHPAAYFLNKLKSNAKRRGVPFNLTLDDFKKFCKETEYLEKKGKTAESATIDRISRDDPRGYHIENIQVLSLSDNSKKFHGTYEPPDDLPF